MHIEQLSGKDGFLTFVDVLDGTSEERPKGGTGTKKTRDTCTPKNKQRVRGMLARDQALSIQEVEVI